MERKADVGSRTIAIVSGYFNPLHIGHLRMIRDAKPFGDLLIVIVNNDQQQILKKGKIIMSEQDRCEIVASIKYVDRVVLSIDSGSPVNETLAVLREEYPQDTLIFANGGDRRDAGSIGEAETCEKLGIHIEFGVGGEDKPDSSSRINEALGV